MDKDTLEKLQKTELEILKEIDAYCRKWDIKYSIYAGTMLGAVRHGGFIPWDDDVDIAMTRNEYTKFCETIKSHPMEGYSFSNFENDRYIQACHGKVGKKGTLFIQEGDIENVGNHEVWVDIFPLDKVSFDKEKAQRSQKIARELVYLTRANGKRTNDPLNKKLFRLVVGFIPRRYERMKKDADKLRLYDRQITDNYEWSSMSTLENIQKIRFQRKMLEEYGELVFCGYKFMSFSDYDGMLTSLYGDYMKLPPESDRICKHSPVKIQF